MSGVLAPLWRLRERIRPYERSAVEVCFGDRTGVTLFLAFLAFFVLTWRVGAFFNDVGLFVPALERLARGHLALGSPFDLDYGYPGMYYTDGQVYARNYGQLVFSLPAYWLVGRLDAAVLRALVAVGWSALLVVVAVRIADWYGRRRLGVALGGTVAAVALVANVLTFRPFIDSQRTIIALQLTAMVVSALIGVFIYRIAARRYGTRLGVVAGALTVFASPVGFWATIPKRHTFTALFVVVALYALARSREGAEGRLGPVGFRAVAYASSGLLAWVHAPEGFTLFLAVAIADLPTAGRRDWRALVTIGAALALSLVPFFLTNYLISGNPLVPPRFLTVYKGPDSIPLEPPDPTTGPESTATPTPGSEATAESGGPTDTPAGGESTPNRADGTPAGQAGTPATGPSGVSIDLEALLPGRFLAILQLGVLRYVEGLRSVIGRPGSIVTVFVRWGKHGYDPGYIFFGNGTNLSVLESLPVAVAVAIAPLRYGVATLRNRSPDVAVDLDAVDRFALTFAVLVVVMYYKLLPNQIMVTVRYLHPLYPLLIYGVVRQRWIRDLLTDHPDHALWGYEATALLGAPLSVGLLLLVDLSKGQFVQWYGLAALGAAAALGLAGLVGTDRRRAGQFGATVLGVTAGLVTVFLLLTAFIVMHYGTSLLPFVESVTAKIRFATLQYG